MPREAKLNVGIGIGEQLAEILEAMQSNQRICQ
jgi:hypothetical protein